MIAWVAAAACSSVLAAAASVTFAVLTRRLRRSTDRILAETAALLDEFQPGADFEPVVPAAGKAGRWAAGRGRRFGRGLRDGWRGRGGPPQDEGKSQ